jgi:L-threonylcarbamoyladenylate synthase
MNDFFNQEVDKALEALRQGAVILYPTDTIWGLGCDASNQNAIQKIYNIKQRPETKSMIILVGEERDILQYVAAPDPAVFDFIQAQEKPTTIIFENAIGLPDNLVSTDGSIAIRLVQDPFCRHLIKRLKKPIVSTSANISGQPAPSNFAAISPEIKKQADCIVQWRQQDSTPAQPSQIIKWNANGTPDIIRS